MDRELERKFDFNVIRELRRARGLTLEILAKEADIAYATLAKLEVNKVNPTVKTLEKIAHTLGIAPGNLLTLAERFSAEQREMEDVNFDGAACRKAEFDDLTVLVVNAPKGYVAAKPYAHKQDNEICCVISGKLRIKVHDKEYELGPGQALKFDAVFEHVHEALEDTEFILVRLRKSRLR